MNSIFESQSGQDSDRSGGHNWRQVKPQLGQRDNGMSSPPCQPLLRVTSGLC